MQAIHASLISRARRARYEALASETRWIEAMDEHERLMEALADRNGRLAGEIMHEHDLGTARAMVAALETMSSPRRAGAVRANRPAAYSAATLRSGSRGSSSSRTISWNAFTAASYFGDRGPRS